jgi:MarR family transcriptional regulator, negative regulator of the multidrug operon emrRAB
VKRTRCDLTENLLGALVLEVNDRMTARVADAAGLGANGPAAVVLLDQEAQLVDRLVGHGLVERRPGRDARVRLVRLTAAGRRAASAVLAERAHVVRDVLAVLSPDERSTLGAVLARLLSSMTTDPASADHLCRLCDVAVCTNQLCPVEAAVTAQRAEPAHRGDVL